MKGLKSCGELVQSCESCNIMMLNMDQAVWEKDPR